MEKKNFFFVFTCLMTLLAVLPVELQAQGEVTFSQIPAHTFPGGSQPTEQSDCIDGWIQSSANGNSLAWTSPFAPGTCLMVGDNQWETVIWVQIWNQSAGNALLGNLSLLTMSPVFTPIGGNNNRPQQWGWGLFETFGDWGNPVVGETDIVTTTTWTADIFGLNNYALAPADTVWVAFTAYDLQNPNGPYGMFEFDEVSVTATCLDCIDVFGESWTLTCNPSDTGTVTTVHSLPSGCDSIHLEHLFLDTIPPTITGPADTSVCEPFVPLFSFEDDCAVVDTALAYAEWSVACDTVLREWSFTAVDAAGNIATVTTAQYIYHPSYTLVGIHPDTYGVEPGDTIVLNLCPGEYFPPEQYFALIDCRGDTVPNNEIGVDGGTQDLPCYGELFWFAMSMWECGSSDQFLVYLEYTPGPITVEWPADTTVCVSDIDPMLSGYPVVSGCTDGHEVEYFDEWLAPDLLEREWEVESGCGDVFEYVQFLHIEADCFHLLGIGDASYGIEPGDTLGISGCWEDEFQLGLFVNHYLAVIDCDSIQQDFIIVSYDIPNPCGDVGYVEVAPLSNCSDTAFVVYLQWNQPSFWVEWPTDTTVCAGDIDPELAGEPIVYLSCGIGLISYEDQPFYNGSNRKWTVIGPCGQVLESSQWIEVITESVTEVFALTCDSLQVGVDTVFLTGQAGCDSLVITTTVLDPFGMTTVTVDTSAVSIQCGESVPEWPEPIVTLSNCCQLYEYYVLPMAIGGCGEYTQTMQVSACDQSWVFTRQVIVEDTTPPTAAIVVIVDTITTGPPPNPWTQLEVMNLYGVFDLCGVEMTIEEQLDTIQCVGTVLYRDYILTDCGGNQIVLSQDVLWQQDNNPVVIEWGPIQDGEIWEYSCRSDYDDWVNGFTGLVDGLYQFEVEVEVLFSADNDDCEAGTGWQLIGFQCGESVDTVTVEAWFSDTADIQIVSALPMEELIFQPGSGFIGGPDPVTFSHPCYGEWEVPVDLVEVTGDPNSGDTIRYEYRWVAETPCRNVVLQQVWVFLPRTAPPTPPERECDIELFTVPDIGFLMQFGEITQEGELAYQVFALDGSMVTDQVSMGQIDPSVSNSDQLVTIAGLPTGLYLVKIYFNDTPVGCVRVVFTN